jgi:hypothetical protein
LIVLIAHIHIVQLGFAKLHSVASYFAKQSSERHVSQRR